MPNSFMDWLEIFGRRRETEPANPLPAPPPANETLEIAGEEKSATVFHGDPQRWKTYLQQPFSRRFDGFYSLHVQCAQTEGDLRFESRNERSVQVAKWLDRSAHVLVMHMAKLPLAKRILEDLISKNSSNHVCPLSLLSHEGLPATATREISFGTDFQAGEVRIVVRTAWLQQMDHEVGLASADSGDLELLGLVWPVLSKILLQLSYPNYPRDRFIERIDITTRWAQLNLFALFREKKQGKLVPNRAGERWLEGLSAQTEIPLSHLFIRHPFCRLLEDISFLMNSRGDDSALEVAKVIVRDYLDARYLRLSIAGLMPAAPEWMTPMACEWKGKKRISTAKPKIGHFGILDAEDLEAWNKLVADFSNIGYFLVRQLAIGQFGRVYEAVNAANPSIPQRVALKVDRFRKGKKKEAIEVAENIMQTARGLSTSPHVIRIFDAGKLKRERSTYHILQLVEGDTLDNLIGVTGTEHASILRPRTARSSADDARREFMSSLSQSHGEIWRRSRKTSLFLKRPSLAHMLDILTSKVLWVEEVHRLGFAVNDLKNGNVMINRRGQFKAIDLDSYSPIFSPFDKLPDFFFLAVSGLQLFSGGQSLRLDPSGLGSALAMEGALSKLLHEQWPYGDPAEASNGRIDRGQVIEFFVGFINDAKSGIFAEEPDRFTRAINKLISIKRLLSSEEMVLE